MFPNLEAEMARRGLTADDISRAIKITPRSVRNKLSGSACWKYKEAVRIKDLFFAGMDLEFLFREVKEHKEE